jgi:hypothetical protein
MIELTYVSRAEKRYEHTELKEMLAIFRRNNKALNITGLLLYDGFGTFIQTIAGESENITSLFQRIRNDTRHSRVNLLAEIEIHERVFSDWRMGFRNLREEPIQGLDGFSDFMQQDDGFGFLNERPTFAIEMLEHFKNSSSFNLDQD